MIKSILLVDDENLFHLVFEDACSLLDITLDLRTLSSAESAEELFKVWQNDPTDKPECVFVDLNIIGSAFDGIELVRRINYLYGNGVVVGIISSSADQAEINRSVLAGSQFWIVKSDEIEPRLEAFREDYDKYKDRTKDFTVYK